MRIEADGDLREWRERVHGFMDREVGVEYCRERYEEGEYPHDLYDGLLDRGWIGLTVPGEYGGAGKGQVEQAVLLEALGKYGYDLGMPALLSTTGAENVLRFGDDEQAERFVPAVMSGEVRFSIGVTEPGTGSDAASIATRAERDGGEYVVSGEKTYQSGAGAPGNHINCYVRTDPDAPKREGLSTLLVPNDAAGVEVEELPLVVRKAAGTYRVRFDGARVPAGNLLGEPGDGWEILSDHLVREHTAMAALMVGNAATAVETAIESAADRERFGRTVADFQAIRHRLADLRTEVDAARMLVYRSASALDRGEGSRRLAAQAKLKAGETLKEAATEGMQVMGGAGFFPENDMERYWREGASATVAGATSEIQRSVIAGSLFDDR